MKKILIAITVVLVLVMALVVPVMAAGQPKDTPANDNGKTIYLYPKDADGPDDVADTEDDWCIVWDGRWAKVTYGNDNVNCAGHGLTPGDEYALVVNGWPGTVIGMGTVNNGGNIQVSGECELQDGDKIWLVPAGQTDGEKMTGWDPDTILFEHDLVGPKD